MFRTLLKFFFFLMIGRAAMAIEEPAFKVEQKTENFEIRNYEATIVAETEVIAGFDDAGNKAFRILADYIFGNNKKKSKIEMTAPVTQQPQAEKIEMTAPVSQVKSEEGFVIQFTMPSKFTLETLPEPNDDRVRIRQLPSRRVAVYEYSGSWSQSRYLKKLEFFRSELEKNKIQTIGEPVFARFNSPFQLWFLRRNEIWLEVKP